MVVMLIVGCSHSMHTVKLSVLSDDDNLPINGTASDVVGIISDTIFMKTVRDRSTVTSGNNHRMEIVMEVQLSLHKCLAPFLVHKVHLFPKKNLHICIASQI